MVSNINCLSLEKALELVFKKEGVFIDVREPAEFYDGHLRQAVNIPFSLRNLELFYPYRKKTIILVCQSGNRARERAENLIKEKFEQVYVLDWHMETIAGESNANRWSVDRQFRMFLGIMIAIFLVGVQFLSTYFYIIPVIICCGLILTSIIDKCYLRIGIAKMPWNQSILEKTSQ
jgi:rhodanese-related sulfurtransferase